jgi:signal transduction histidine kinase
MQMFLSNDEVARLEQTVPNLSGTQRLQHLVELAWHLRERNTNQALELANLAEASLATSVLPLGQRQRLAARLGLLRCQANWLFGQLDAALALLTPLLPDLERLADWQALADAHWLHGKVLSDQGQPRLADVAWQRGLQVAQRGQDTTRARLLLVARAIGLAYSDQQAAVQQYGMALDVGLPNLDGSVLVAYHDFWGVVRVQRSEFAGAIESWSQCCALGRQYGQLNRTIMVYTNIGDCFNNLNDHHSALEWMQRGLDLARGSGWPSSIGGCLMQMGETLRRLGRLQAAQDISSEALTALASLNASRVYAIALAYSGDLALDLADWAGAYRTFCHLYNRANSLDYPEFQIMAMRGQANALLELKCPDSALVASHAAYAMALKKQDPFLRIAVLRTLANIHARYPSLPAPPGMVAANPQLHYLTQAQQVAHAISGYTVPGDLFDELADAHAAAADFDQAWLVACAAQEAREKTHSQEAGNRAVALQVRYQTERAETLREQHRQLALAEAKRVAALQQISDILAHLGAIGQEITAHLEAEGVFNALNRHVHRLLDAASFSIWLLDADGQNLSAVFSREHGQPAPLMHVPLTLDHANSARAVRERREIMINLDLGSDDPSLIPGTLVTLSRLFAPLMVEDRVLGVMTIQSLREHAYAEHEQLIFRTLCSYGAIALDNAHAYAELQQAQDRLVAQEKLAALGALVAGVAHELNGPIGNSLLMTTALQEKTDVMHDKIGRQCLTQLDLDEFLQDANDSAGLILATLGNAAALVSSFKQVAVDRTSAKRRLFNLQQTCQEIILTLNSQIRLSGHTIELEVAGELIMDSYPGPLGQVLGNLIGNALLHAFDGISHGKMLLSAHAGKGDLAGRVIIGFLDNGVGIPESNLARIFEPFFTTKSGQGDGGLGMSIAYNIVTSLLAGKISVESEPGHGTRFVLDLPLVVGEVQEQKPV